MVLEFRQIDVSLPLPSLASISVEVDPLEFPMGNSGRELLS